MTVDAAIYHRLSNFAGLTALTGQDIYSMFVPQEYADRTNLLPAVVYRVLGSDTLHALRDDTQLASYTVQVDAFADNLDDAHRVREQVKRALRRYHGTAIQDAFLDSEFDDYDVEADAYQLITRWTVWHANQPPIVQNNPPTGYERSGLVGLLLSGYDNYFADPDGDTLTYETRFAVGGSETGATVSHTLVGTVLTVDIDSPQRIGTDTIEVVATDSGGESVVNTFTYKITSV
jgi:hypothetical protein